MQKTQPLLILIVLDPPQSQRNDHAGNQRKQQQNAPVLQQRFQFMSIEPFERALKRDSFKFKIDGPRQFIQIADAAECLHGPAADRQIGELFHRPVQLKDRSGEEDLRDEQ